MSPQRKHLLLALLALLGTLCIVAHASPTPNTSRSLHSGSVSSRGDYPIGQVNRRTMTVAQRLEEIEELKKATRRKLFMSKEEKTAQYKAVLELERQIMLAHSAISADDTSTEATKVREHYTWLMKEKGLI